MSDAALDRLDEHFMALLAKIGDTTVVIEDYQQESKVVLDDCLREIGGLLVEIDRDIQFVPMDLTVPVSLVETVERGENPDVFTLAQLDEVEAARSDCGRRDELVGALKQRVENRLKR